MKTTITLLLACLSFSAMNALAEVKLPKSSFTLEALEAALKTARDEKKPVAYLYTKKETTCPLAAGASEGFMDAVGRKCVLVYLPVSGKKSSQLSDAVRKELLKGSLYPKLVIASPDGSSVKGFTYESYKADAKKVTREIKKEVQTMAKK